jgi:hypothetical protein
MSLRTSYVQGFLSYLITRSVYFKPFDLDLICSQSKTTYQAQIDLSVVPEDILPIKRTT